jgi:formate--tetrahydrofolate ligase
MDAGGAARSRALCESRLRTTAGLRCETHLSLSHDPSPKGAPSGYTFPIRPLRLAAGAGYLYALTGDITTMPRLPSHPHAAQIDLDPEGKITGLV